MEKTIHPSQVSGEVRPPCSKSYAQRALAAALLSDGETTLSNIELCDDTRYAMNVITGLGASVRQTGPTEYVIRGGLAPITDTINTGESGLATRLFTPIAALCDQAHDHHRHRHHAPQADRHDDRPATEPRRTGQVQRLPSHYGAGTAQGR